MSNTLETYKKYITNCKNPDNLFGGCYECCPMRENGCCELSQSELAFLSLQKLGINIKRNFSLNELPMLLLKETSKIKKYRKALVSGSFDPFTIGHLAMVKQASELFDEIHVVIFPNSSKKRTFDVDMMLDAIRETLVKENINNAIVNKGHGLLADYCSENNITNNIRGVRNTGDYDYEESLMYANSECNPDLKTIYFPGNNKVSSTLVREFLSYGKDVSKYVPEPVYRVITNNN